MRTKAGLPTTTIVIIAIVIMLVATILIFLALPTIEDTFKTGPCDDTCYVYVHEPGAVYSWYEDCEHPNRYIQHYHDSIYYDEGWQYYDNFEGFQSDVFDTLHQLRQAIQAQYEGNNISEGSWHWFDCTAEAIS